MRLTEFLEQHLPAFKFIEQIDKQYDILITPYDDEYVKSWFTHSFSAGRNDLYDQLQAKGISVKEFEEIIRKFGWYISYVNTAGDRINFTVENNLDNQFEPDLDDAIFKNLYLHISNIQPSRIREQGLIAKDSTDRMFHVNMTMTRGILYPNRRVYLWNLAAATSYLKPWTSGGDKRMISAFNTIFNGIDAKNYGRYVYLIRLPSTVKTHFDNEYGTDNPARYITQNIPPSYIKYIGTTERMLTVIKDNDADRLRAIFGI